MAAKKTKKTNDLKSKNSDIPKNKKIIDSSSDIMTISRKKLEAKEIEADKQTFSLVLLSLILMTFAILTLYIFAETRSKYNDQKKDITELKTIILEQKSDIEALKQR
jgi:cell division protein FtsL